MLFKKSWGIIGEKITKAILQILNPAEMYLPINVTTVTLIPKVHHPSTIKEFRPISCCIVLYKIIFKILTNRLQGVIDNLVDKSQSGFVSGRVITDNIIPSHELVKGYGRKGISPICMIKLDLQKAYDFKK